MRSTLLLSGAALIGLALATPAFAQQSPDENTPAGTPGNATGTMARPGHEPGVGVSEPASGRAGHIQGAERSTIAPRLPTPPGGENASAETYLRDAQTALRRHRTGQAQEALERAETAFLNSPANPSAPGQPPATSPAQQTTEQARQALGNRNTSEAERLVDQALSQVASNGGRPMGTMGSTGNTMGTGGEMGAPQPGGGGMSPPAGTPGAQPSPPAGAAGAPTGQ
jgi:hypothetical protein